jgi:hypothetical protein
MMTHAYPLWESAQREAGQSVYTNTGGLDWGRKGSDDIEGVVASCKRYNVVGLCACTLNQVDP